MIVMESQLTHFPHESALGFYVANVQGCQPPPVHTCAWNSFQTASLMMVLQEKKWQNLTQLHQ